MIEKDQNQDQMINHVESVMLRHPEIFHDLEAIKKTKVPIIKFTEKEFGIQFDLSFNQEDGLKNNIEI
jgi:DNA polymerase sigma